MSDPSQANDAFHPTREESQLISVTRAVMIAGLTYHHLFAIPGSAYYPRQPLEHYSHWAPDLVNGFVHLSFMAAVPALSVISGYLLFRRSELDFAWLLRKRFYSVALPSWLWSALWLGLAFVAYSFGRDRGWFEWASYEFAAFGWLALANGIVGVTQEPFAFQFWFVHDLILTLLLAPILHRLLAASPALLLAGLGAVWLSGFVPPPFFSMNVLLFFAIGAYLGDPRGPGLVRALDALRPLRWYLWLAFLAVVGTRLLSHRLPELAPLIDGHGYLCLMRVLGVLAFSQALCELVRRGGMLPEMLVRYSGYSFFVFAAHYPTIELVKILAVRVPGATSALGLFAQWLVIPLATIGICIVGAKVLEQWLPGLFRVLNGGRSGAPVSPRTTSRPLAGAPGRITGVAQARRRELGEAR
jgi:succinoglycan biosynthesis protein ExoH